MNRKKYLLKNTAVFALSNLGTKLISFLLVPVYTGTLTTEQYGIVDLISTIITISVPIVTFNIGEAVMRFSLDRDADQDKISSIGMLFAIISVLLSLFTVPVCLHFSQVKEYTLLIYVFCVSEGLFTISYCFLRGKEKLFDFAVCNITVSFISAILNIVFLVIVHFGIRGYFYSFCLANLVAAVYGFYKSDIVSGLPRFQIDKSLMKSMLAYSIVLVPNSFMWWIMNSSDRIMVTAFVGVTANGIYAIAYKIPSILSILSRIFNQAWSYSAIQENASKDRDEFNNQMLNVFTQFLLVITGFFMVVIKPFLKIYVADDYYSAWKYTPYLLIGFFFMSLGTFISTSYTVNKDSKGFLYSGTAGAITNIILNWLLLPRIGVSGAALATCISYFVVVLYRFFDTKKYIKYRLFNKQFILGSVILITMGFTMYIDTTYTLLLLSGEYIVLLIFMRKFFMWGLSIVNKIVKKTRG